LGTDVASQVFGSYQPLLPVFADRAGVGVVGFGILSSAPSAGALLGAITIVSLGDVRYKGWWIVGSILAYCLCLIGLALSPWFASTWLFAAGLGFTNTMQATPRNTVIQLVTPDHLRGRVTSFRNMLAGGGPSIGQALIGLAATLVGAPLALIAGAVACIVLNIGIMAKDRELRSEHLAMEPEPEPVVPA
jgi:MFS family permease